MSADKHSREAELKAERATLAKLEEQYAAERGRLNAELFEAQRAEAEAIRDHADARKRARDATAARDVIQERADERLDPCALLLGVCWTNTCHCLHGWSENA